MTFFSRSKQEHLAQIMVIILLVGIGLLIISGVRPGQTKDAHRMIELRARMPEKGGWMPGEIKMAAGETIILRLLSDDVMHGFAIGQSDLPAINLAPGKIVETTLTFDEPGRYTYYCTRWCGPNHWRMRGVIEVTGEETRPASTAESPPYLDLGIDIDNPHPAEVIPDSLPNAYRGAQLDVQIPAELFSPKNYRASSPARVWLYLRAETSLSEISDEALWDVVAWIWQQNTTPEALVRGKELYIQNCAACHGQDGGGDGVFALNPASETHESTPQVSGSEMSGHGVLPPVDFTSKINTMGASPALLHGKIVRGGMGTGMPYWGPIFTDEEVWSLVAYLYTFQMELE